MNDLVKVDITATVITSRYGSLGPGDTLRTDAAYAKHLVEDCQAAKYSKNSVAPARKKPAKKGAE